MVCYHCGAALPAPAPGTMIGRRDTCPGCNRHLHACVQCGHWDPGARVCREPQAEEVRDREAANFCDWFRLGPHGSARGDRDAAQRAREAADALFSRKSG